MIITPDFCVFHFKNVGAIFMIVKYFLYVVVQSGTEAHWVNPLPIPKQYILMFLKNYLHIETFFAIILRQMNNKAYFGQTC